MAAPRQPLLRRTTSGERTGRIPQHADGLAHVGEQGRRRIEQPTGANLIRGK